MMPSAARTDALAAQLVAEGRAHVAVAVEAAVERLAPSAAIGYPWPERPRVAAALRDAIGRAERAEGARALYQLYCDTLAVAPKELAARDLRVEWPPSWSDVVLQLDGRDATIRARIDGRARALPIPNLAAWVTALAAGAAEEAGFTRSDVRAVGAWTYEQAAGLVQDVLEQIERASALAAVRVEERAT